MPDSFYIYKYQAAVKESSKAAVLYQLTATEFQTIVV